MKLWKLLVLISFICVLEAKSHKHKPFKKKKTSCHKNHCYNMEKLLATMCICNCISPRCFEQVYGNNILDYGEVDWNREVEFEKCAKTTNLK